MLNYKRQISSPFVTSSLILLVALCSLFFSGYQLIKINELDDKIDQFRFEIVLLENAMVRTEAAQRGYIATRSSNASDAFNQGRQEIRNDLFMIQQSLLSFKELKPAFVPVFAKLEQYIQGDFELMDKPVRAEPTEAEPVQAQFTHQPVSPAVHQIKTDVSLSPIMDAELKSVNAILLEHKNQIRQQIQHALEKAMWVGMTLLVVMLGILFSGYRRTIHLFELAVLSRNEADEFSHDAYHDALTRLPNRRYFEEHLTTVFLQAKRHHQSIALLYMDLDGFKLINDQHGHDAGDEALKYVTQLLKSALRETDFLTRLGGDEFAIVVQHEAELSALEVLTHRIIDQFKAPFTVNDRNCKLGISIGVSSFPNNADSVGALVNKADDAMYQAKRTGKNRAIFA